MLINVKHNPTYFLDVKINEYVPADSSQRPYHHLPPLKAVVTSPCHFASPQYHIFELWWVEELQVVILTRKYINTHNYYQL